MKRLKLFHPLLWRAPIAAVLLAVVPFSNAQVFISEFMAANTKTLADRDRHYSDWIELYNASTNAVDLEGWCLTDNRTDLTQWRFPATNLAANGYLIVFASQKNRRVPGAELHTNFKLNAKGDYLALVKPDGTTVASEYAPTYPAQVSGVSYGLSMSDSTETLVAPAATKQVLVPTNDLGLHWTSLDYSSAGWTVGTNGVGFSSTNYQPLIGTDIRPLTQSATASAYVRIPFMVAEPGFTALRLRMQYDDGFIAYLNGSEVARRNAPSAAEWNSSATASHGPSRPSLLEEDFESGSRRYALPQVDSATQARVSVAGNTGSTGRYLRLLNGRLEKQANSIAFPQTGFGLTDAMIADFDFRSKSLGDGADAFAFMLIPISIYGANGAGASISTFRDTKQPKYSGVFAVNFELYPRSAQNNISLYWDRTKKASYGLRGTPLELAPRVFHHAQIRLKRENKGALISVTLTANINGRNPQSYTINNVFIPGMDPYASRVQFAARIEEQDRTFDLDNIKVQFIPSSILPAEEFDISSSLNLLRAGPNMLAIHGLNSSVNDPDFFILPELIGRNINLRTNSPGYFSVPSPKAANQEALPEMAPAPEFTVAGGVYTKDVSVELKARTGEIRYTLDGSEPTESALLCAGPITVGRSTLLKAKTFAPGLLPSITATETYTLLDDGLENFRSNLPLVIINSFGQYIYHGRDVPASIRIIDCGKGYSSLTAPADFDGRAEIHARGSSTLKFQKHSYTFKLRDHTTAKSKVAILGFPKESDWILYAPYSDKTLIRDVLAYELSSQMGHYASRTRFVEVYLQSSGGKLTQRDYAGVYVLEEKIKRSKKRVNIEEVGSPGTELEFAL